MARWSPTTGSATRRTGEILLVDSILASASFFSVCLHQIRANISIGEKDYELR